MINESLFPVREVPAQLGADIIKQTGHKFIMREDTGEILSCMTDEYKLVTNKEIMDTALPILKKCGAKPREVKVLNEGKRTVYKFNMPEMKIPISKDDICTPEIIIKNSYDGSWELGIMSGAFRLICLNGAVIGIVLNKKRNRHSIHNQRLDQLEEMIISTIESTKKVFESDFPLLKDTKVRQTHIKQMIDKVPNHVMEPFVQHLIAEKPETYWDLFNAATWVNTHHMNRNWNTTHKFEQQIYPTIDKWAKGVAKA